MLLLLNDPELETAEFDYSIVGGKGVRRHFLNALGSNESIKHLTIYSASEESAARAINRNRSITTLVATPKILGGINANRFKSLSEINANPKLYGSMITSSTAMTKILTAAIQFMNLRTLDISDASINAQGIDPIVTLLRLGTSLQDLNLSKNAFQDEGLQKLTQGLNLIPSYEGSTLETLVTAAQLALLGYLLSPSHILY